jgi:hypothetical protein
MTCQIESMLESFRAEGAFLEIYNSLCSVIIEFKSDIC